MQTIIQEIDVTAHNQPKYTQKGGHRTVKLVLLSLLLTVSIYQLFTEPSLAAVLSVLESLALIVSEL